MEEEVKVKYKLKKAPLASERKEIRQKRKRIFMQSVMIILVLVVGVGFGIFISSTPTIISGMNAEKTEIIDAYMENFWLYGNEYEDLHQTLSDKAYYGMTSFEDDPYTTYQSNAEMKEFASSINMNFVGIGVSYTLQNNVATIIRVFKSSPAEKAGLLPGDVIKFIDDVSIDGLDTEQIREMVIGENGSVVKVGVMRQGTLMEFAIARGPIDSTVYGYEYNGVPVLELISFGENTYEECIKYLDEYRYSDKLIIDLRNNGGGYQTSVEAIAGLFIGNHKIVMHTINKDGDEVNSYSKSDVYYDNFKEIAILTNEGTASAAEVLTICLMEQHPNAYSVGTTTYGKGVVQSTFQLADGSALKLTTSKWVSPNHVWINGEGIAPTYDIRQHDVLYEIFYDIEEEVYQYDSVSGFVRVSQEALDYLGYKLERTDGYFDKSFEKALNDFKYDCNLNPDGKLDKQTYEAILSAVIRTKSMDLTKDTQLNFATTLLKG